MTQFVFANNVSTTLASAVTSGDTTITLASVTNFPSIPSDHVMSLTLNDAATRSIYEIVYVTSVSGNTATVERAQEGTSAQNWSIGDYALGTVTAGALNEYSNGNAAVGLTETAVATPYTLQSTDGGKFLIANANEAFGLTLGAVLPIGARIGIGTKASYTAAITIPSGITVMFMGASFTNTTLTLPATAAGDEAIILSYIATNLFLAEMATPLTENAAGAGSPSALAGATRNLVIAYSTATELVVAADEIQVAASLGGATTIVSSLSVTLNIGTTGLNGMDTGSASASAGLSLYAIAGPGETPGVLACLGSTSNGTIYSGAHMPTGYTQSALIGSYLMNGSAQFNSFNQLDRQIVLDTPIPVLSNGTATSWTEISLSGVVPNNAKICSGSASIVIAASGGENDLSIASDNTGAGSIAISCRPGAATGGGNTYSIGVPFSGLFLLTAQAIWYRFSTITGGSGNILINGYSF